MYVNDRTTKKTIKMIAPAVSKEALQEVDEALDKRAQNKRNIIIILSNILMKYNHSELLKSFNLLRSTIKALIKKGF